MPKYRLLTAEELLPLEKEFIEFLILNGIDANDWKSIQNNDPKKYDHTLALFSDVVFESILRKINYLEYRSKNSLITFQCLEQKLVAITLTSTSEKVDFLNPQFIQEAQTNPPEGLKVTTVSRSYQNEREAELFEMLQTGCTISDNKLFKTLGLMLPL